MKPVDNLTPLASAQSPLASPSVGSIIGRAVLYSVITMGGAAITILWWFGKEGLKAQIAASAFRDELDRKPLRVVVVKADETNKVTKLVPSKKA